MSRLYFLAILLGIGAARFCYGRAAFRVAKLPAPASRRPAKLQRLSFRFFSNHASGSLINRVTGDVQNVRLFVVGVILQVVTLALSLVFYLTYMLGIHVGLTLLCLATTPLLGWLI